MKRKAAPAPPLDSSFPQREGASPKQLLIFELLRARAQVIAVLQGLPAGAAEARPAGGGWNIREMVLHLHAWDIEVQRVLETAFRGISPPWARFRRVQVARLNEELLAPLRGLPWEEACRRLHLGRNRLLEELEGLPEEPAALWTKRHALGRAVGFLPHHDHHHAEAIQSLREAVGAPSGGNLQPRST